MTRIHHLAPLFLLLACNGGDGTDGTDGTDGVTPDPDADSYIPADYAPAGPARIIYLGDSITAGAEASRTSLAYTSLLVENDDSTWPDHTELDLESLYGDVEVIDVSVGGAVTDDLDDQIADLQSQVTLPLSGETLVVFTIGGNDLQGALNPLADPDAIAAAALDNVEAAVDWFQDPANLSGDNFIYATNVYEPSDGEGQVADCFFGFDYSDRLPALEQYNADLRTMGEDMGFSVVDLRGHFLGHGFYHDDAEAGAYDADDPSMWFASDCIHPNDRGHHELRRLFHSAIEGVPLPLDIPSE